MILNFHYHLMINYNLYLIDVHMVNNNHLVLVFDYDSNIDYDQ